MAQRIKGITIELDGETKGLDKALSDVNKRSRELQKELRDVERLLKLDPGNVEALAQKQQILAKQIENTTERLNRLKAAQAQVEQQFQRGEIGADQYRAFRREIQFTEAQLSKFKRELESVNETKALKNTRRDADRVAESLDKAKEAAGELRNQLETVGAASAAGAVAAALDLSSLNTSIEISMNVPAESVESVKSAVKTVTSYIGDQEAALEGVRRQWALNANASDEANARIVKGAAAITRAYAGIDFTELIQETNEVSKSLEISNDEALGLVNALLKMGFPPEQLDIISEYGLQLRMAGYEAEEIQAIFAAGIDTGTWNIDNLLDGLKEGRIRLAEFGEEVPKAMAELLEETNISAEQMQKWGQAVAQGGEVGKQAMVEVAQAIDEIEDATIQNAVGVATFGTMWEDQGRAIIDTILGAKNQVVDLKVNQEQLNESIQQLDNDPVVKFKQALQELQTALSPLLDQISNIVMKIADFIQNNPQLAATIMTIVGVVGTLLGVLTVLGPIISGITATIGLLAGAFGVASSTVLVAIGVLASLITIGVLVWQNWDTIKAKAIEIWGAIKNWLVQTWENIKTQASEKWESMKQTIQNKMESARQKIQGIWNSILSFLRSINLYQIGKDIIQGLLNGISSMAKRVYSKAQEIANGIKNRIKSALSIHSPSRVMMELGEYTGEGFAIGLESAIRNIQRASDQLAAASIPQQGSGSLVSTSNDRVNNITVYNYGQDLSGQSVIDALRRKEWLS
jgi:phage-related minor tail protein